MVRLHPLLIFLLLTTLAGFFSGLLLPQLLPLRPAPPLHLVFALGIMPLIMGAMTYFVPVLTRTRTAEPLALAPALLALGAGLLLSFSLFFSFSLYPFAALIGLVAAFWLSLWMQQRKRQTLGRPHPGLLWYQLALLALILGLLAILAGQLLPEYWSAFRRLHLHLNLLGFVGLTALGTLRVLLPTTGGYADPGAGTWLMRQWPWLAAGTLLVAAGSVGSAPLALLGLLLWLPPLGRLLHSLLITHRQAVWHLHGATVSLAGAVLGLLILLLSGALHALSPPAGAATTQAFIPLFLLPLVTGAATHLLPLWITGAADREREQALQARLGRYSALRAALFLSGGLLILAGQSWGLIPVLLGLLHFVLAVLIALFMKS
jgi:hypothetical protein